jgi:hypothetical protein
MMIAQVAHGDHVEIIVMLIEKEFLRMTVVVVAPVNEFLFVKYQFFHSLSYHGILVTAYCLSARKQNRNWCC